MVEESHAVDGVTGSPAATGLAGSIHEQNKESSMRKKIEGDVDRRSKKKKKKHHLSGSSDSSSPVGEASMRETKKEKCKNKVDQRARQNAAEKSTESSKDSSGPSSPRENELDLKTLKTGLHKKRKKVSFSECEEVFPTPDSMEHPGDHHELVIGKRYSAEEDELTKDAILRYLKEHGMEESESYKLFNSRIYPQIKGCWKEINAALPWRTSNSVRVRAENLLLTSRKGKWSSEEIEIVQKYSQEHGKGLSWKCLSELLGRERRCINLAWLRMKSPNLKKGHWSQDEYQKLFDLVNADLRMKAFDRKEFRNTMIKDNISWLAISDSLGTRNQPRCCSKWYRQLASPMVAEGLWSDINDYSLVNALSELDASCAEDVDWDNLVENRSGDTCRRRWKEMTRHAGGKKESSFAEMVEILSLRYCKDMIEYRSGDTKTL